MANNKSRPAKVAPGRRRRQPLSQQAPISVRDAAFPNSFQLIGQSLSIVKRYWKPLGAAVLVYMLLNVLFASGISSINSSVESIKSDFNNTSLNSHPLLSASTGFLLLVTSSGASGNSAGGVLQTALIIIQSLVIIWMLRHLLAGGGISVKQAYYNSTASLIPFLLVLAVIFIQLLPITVGSGVLAGVASALGSISGLWSFIFGFILVGLIGWSFYMLSSSIFALYIVTLPNMQPMNALRSAKNLVRQRRLVVLRRVLFLPLFILVCLGVIIIPLILYATPLATPVFYLLSATGLAFVHSYLYSLYRGLLG